MVIADADGRLMLANAAFLALRAAASLTAPAPLAVARGSRHAVRRQPEGAASSGRCAPVAQGLARRTGA
ncbi:MAG: hypothetical protein MZW92_69805 [Comamonadaceae bacterium]|nr:hypothetical protein [Comamonadaceae bacterium]